MGPPWQPVIVVIHNDTNRPIKLIAAEGPRLGAGLGRIGHMTPLGISQVASVQTPGVRHGQARTNHRNLLKQQVHLALVLL